VTQAQFVTATWARRHVYEILDRVAAGATIVVTRYGKPVAHIVPHDQLNSRPQTNEPLPDEEHAEANS
jgi:prevent-host-death family protein